MINRKSKIFIHLLFWLILFVSTGLEVIPLIGKYSTGFLAGDYFIYVASYIIAFYVFYFSISSKLLNSKKYFKLIIPGALLVFLITLLTSYIHTLFLSGEVFELSGKQFYFTFGRIYLNFLHAAILYAIAGTLLKLAFLWYENTMKQKEAEKKNITSELALLRSQINPRFLSYSLGHIRSLINNQPDKAVYSIENLSEIMSYMLYETSSEKVPLEDEINYISNYINLQKIRFVPGYIELDITGDTNGIKVPPLLFMPFLEKTFRSAAEDISEIPGIAIRLNINGSHLYFETMNYTGNNNNNEPDENAFSISSLRRFLDLQLSDKYKLETLEENNKKIIKLDINLL